MRKWIRRIAGIALAAALLLAVGGYLFMDALAGRAVERGGRYAMGVPTRVAAVNLRPLRGEIDLRRLQVANPAGFERPHFFALDDARATVELRSLWSRRVVLPRLHLHGLHLAIEHDAGGRANYQHVLDRLGEVSGQNQGRRYHVRELLLTEVTVVLENPLPFGPRDGITLELDDLRLTDVGPDAEEGVLMSQLCGIIVRAVIEAVAAEAGRSLPRTMLERFLAPTSRPSHEPAPRSSP